MDQGQPTMQQPSIFGNLLINTYTIILLGFRIPDTVPKDAVVKHLNEAALKLTTAFPFLAGQVIVEGKDAKSTGVYHTVPFAPHTPPNTVVRVKDCEHLCPSFDELSAAKAPMSMLDGDILSPRKGFWTMYDLENSVNPVLLIQANFIKGGLLLNFASQHNALDMNGAGQMMRLFATACRGDEFLPEDLKTGNMDSAQVARFLKDDEPKLEHREMRVPSSLGVETAAPPPAAEVVPAPWVVFRFEHSQVEKLKAKASEGAREGQWISTNDAVTAFFWQRLLTAKQKRFPDVTSTTLLRAIDGRRVMAIPASRSFMGHSIFVVPTSTTVAEVLTAPLSVLATELRSSLSKIDDYYFRSLATCVRDEKDRTTLSYGAQFKSAMDILTSSFAGLGVLHCSFGPLLGQAEFARRPRLDDAEGLSYLMPKSINGDLYLVISLPTADVEALQRDPVWKEHVELIG